MTPVTLVPRPALGQVVAYDQDPPGCRISLADNTNAFGAPAAALTAVRTAGEWDLASNPSTYSAALRARIAEYVGVQPSEVILGCGSGDIIDCAFRGFGPEGGSVAFLSPTFVMTPAFALTNGLRPIPVPLTADHDVDADAVLGSDADVTYLCSPNNPTGGLLSARAIERVLGEMRGLILLDEAYAEYAGRSHAAVAPAHGRLLVIRTFSKAFGLAGLRIGYGVGAAPLIRALEKVRGPFKITSVGEAAAVAALTRDLSWMHRIVGETMQIRDDVLSSLRAVGRNPLRSDANFFLLPVRDARSGAATLLARGVHVRALEALPGIGDALRITVGPRDVMQFVLDVLRDVA